MEEKFSYNYSADRNEELRKIREKYEIKKTILDEVEREYLWTEKLKRLEKSVELYSGYFLHLFLVADLGFVLRPKECLLCLDCC